MKHFNYLRSILFMALIGLVAISCEGPAGADGTDGMDGAIGPQGVTGNANVVLYEYGSATFTSFQNYLLTDMPQSRIDSSIVLAYYNPSNEVVTAWYAVPGIGSSAAYQVRNFWYQTSISPSVYTMAVRTQNLDGSTNSATKTFTKFRIFVASASSILPGGRYDKDHPDFSNAIIDVNDYNAVCRHFGINPEN